MKSNINSEVKVTTKQPDLFNVWLMGYPIGHTELKDWATAWFRPVREKRL
jgi:hypothetical protein